MAVKKDAELKQPDKFKPQDAVQPGHKKSQSMINSKIANLLLKGAKNGKKNVNPQMIQNHPL